MDFKEQARQYANAAEGTSMWLWLEKQFDEDLPIEGKPVEEWMMERIQANPPVGLTFDQEAEEEYDPTAWEAQPLEMEVDTGADQRLKTRGPLSQSALNLVELPSSREQRQLPSTHISPRLLHQPSSQSTNGNGTIKPASLSNIEISSTPGSSRQPSPAEPSPAPPSPPSESIEIDTQKLRSLLAPISMIKAPVTSATNLFKFLSPIAAQLPAKLRQEVINAITNSAEARYYAALLKSETVLSVLEVWLKDLFGKAADEFKGTGYGLLEIVKKLPVTSETLLKMNKIPRYVRKISEKAANEKVKDAAKSLVAHYEKMLDEHDKKPSASSASTSSSKTATEGSASKKRKVESVASSKSASSSSSKPTSSASKPSSSSSTSKSTTPKSTSSTSTSSTSKPASAASFVKTDSSFFQKPQVALPTIKKKPPTTSTTPSSSSSTPSTSKPSSTSTDPFALAMRHLTQPVQSAPPAAAPRRDSSDGPSVLGKRGIGEVEEASGGGKKKKQVVWRDSVMIDGKLGELNAVREFTQADHEIIRNEEHDPFSETAHDEGDLLKQGLTFQEDIDWYQPELIELPSEMLNPELPILYTGTEASAQQAREAQSLAAMYMSELDVPDTPLESPADVTIVGDGPTTQRFLLPRAYRPAEPGEEATPEPEVTQVQGQGMGQAADVGSMLALLGTVVPGLGGSLGTGMGMDQQQQQQQQYQPNPHQQQYPPAPLQQQHPPYGVPAPSHAPYGAHHDPYASQHSLYSQPPPAQSTYPGHAPPAPPAWYNEEDQDRNGGGNGRGRGGGRNGERGGRGRASGGGGGGRRKTVPCTYYRTARGCAKGEDCQFLH